MGSKKIRPVTPGMRGQVSTDFKDITKKKPEKSLLQSKKSSGGRNNKGRITSRHRGGGHKPKYRVIDFKRIKDGIPARVAGVKRIVVVSPPNQNGKIDPLTLVACVMCGATEIYKSGGAQAIGALAYGTKSIKKVNKIVGSKIGF